MIKQTRGALNFLIASYKAILKHAVLATALSSVAMVSIANAKTYDLSDDNGYYEIEQFYDFDSKQNLDQRVIDGGWGNTDTHITKTNDPNYDGVRNLYRIINNDGNMIFTNGGNLNVDTIFVQGGNLDASNTDIVAKSVFLDNNQALFDESYTNAKFGNLRVTSSASSHYVHIKADNVYLDKEGLYYFHDLETQNLYAGYTGVDKDPSAIFTEVGISNLKAENTYLSSPFGCSTVVGMINHFDNDEVNNLSIGSNTFVMTGIDPTTHENVDYAYDAMLRYGITNNPVANGGGFNSILYVNNQDGLKIKNGGGITVDGNVVSPKVEANTVTIGDYSAIILSKNATDNALVSGKNIPAISFADGVIGTVKYSANSRAFLILLQ